MKRVKAPILRCKASLDNESSYLLPLLKISCALWEPPTAALQNIQIINARQQPDQSGGISQLQTAQIPCIVCLAPSNKM